MSMMMSEEDKKKIEANRPKLMECINLEDGLLLAHLRSKGVITEGQEGLINQAGLSTLKVKEMLDIILKRDCNAFDNFITALNKTNHRPLVEECFGTAAARDLPTRPPLDPDYCYACQLAKDKDARDKFLERLRRESERMVPRSSLLEVVRKVGSNEKRLEYLVFLVPEVCEQIGRLFVIKRVQMRGCWRLSNFQYYIDLIKACKDNVQSKDTLLRALVEAEVTVDHLPLSSEDSHESIENWFDLLQQLNNEQCTTLLSKTHNLQLRLNGEQQSTISSTDKPFNANEFVLAVAYMYDCSIIADHLEMSDVDLPVCMLTRNMSGVKRLHLSKCELCEAVPSYMPTRDKLTPLQSQLTPSREDSLLEELDFYSVRGMTNLGHCSGIITSRPCRLTVFECDDVKAPDLKEYFPEIRELRLDYNTVLQLDDTAQAKRRKGLPATEEDDNTTATQLSIVDKIAEIGPIIEFFGKSVHMAKVFRSNVDTEAFQITAIRPTTENKPLQHDIVMHADTGPGFALPDSVPLGQFLDACSPCLQCRRIKTKGDTIDFKGGSAFYRLSELELVAQGIIDLDKILVFCGRCPELKKVIINSTVYVDDDALKAVPQKTEMVTFIFKNVWIVQKQGAWGFERIVTQDKLRQSVHTSYPLADVEFEQYPEEST